MIPQTKLIPVKKALQKTFGVNEYEDIRMLTAGLSSAFVFRIVVKGTPYLLRIITATDAINDPTHQFTCMKIAAKAGIAPRIWYMSIEDRILITDFIEAQPLPIDEAKVKLAEMLHKLHSLPPFPKLVNYLDTVDNFIRNFKSANILPESFTKELFALYSLVSDAYPRDDKDLVSCHNDLKPENILFDGERTWLVDWEASFLNDRYADLAIVANFVVRNDNDESDYLQRYFEKEIDEYAIARFFLMRQIVHMFYFTVFMLLGSAGKPIDPNMEKLDFRDIHDRIWAGEISLSTNEAKLQYAWAHMQQLLCNMNTTSFKESLHIVSNYHLNKL
ncbi:phosphotransferase [Clostridium sp. Marseille-QA1073]